MFLGVGIRLVDFKIEIGRVYDGDFQRLIVADEISPDSLPALGHRDRAQARQGRVPPGPGRPVGRLHRGRQAARGDAAHQRPHPCRAEAGELMQAGDESPGARDAEARRARPAGRGGAARARRARLRRAWATVRIGKVIELDLADDRRGGGAGQARGDVREAARQHRDRELRGGDRMSLRAGVVVFPGSNCDRDLAVALRRRRRRGRDGLAQGDRAAAPASTWWRSPAASRSATTCAAAPSRRARRSCGRWSAFAAARRPRARASATASRC